MLGAGSKFDLSPTLTQLVSLRASAVIGQRVNDHGPLAIEFLGEVFHVLLHINFSSTEYLTTVFESSISL